MGNLSYSKSQFSWLHFLGIILLQATSGTQFIISVHSSLWESHFHLSQVQLNYLIVALDTGRLFGWFTSAASDYLPMWMILLIGLIFTSVGYGVEYMSLVHKIPYISYWHVFVLNVIAGISMCWINTYCRMVVVKKFKDHHEFITTLTSSYSLLGGKFYTLLVEGTQGNKSSRNASIYLLFSFLVPTVVGIAVTLLFSCSKELTEYGELDAFPLLFMAAIITEAYALLETLATPFQNISSWLRLVTLVLAIALPLVVLSAITTSWLAVKKWHSRVMPEVSSVSTNSNSERVIKVLEITNDEEGGGINGDFKVGIIHRVKDLVMNIDFWIYFWVNACGVTLAIIYVYNLGRISESRGNYEASFLLAISSLSGFLARVVTVSFDWYTRERPLISRPALMVLMMIPMPVSFFLLTNNSNTYLYISTCILGTFSGALTAITASMTSELFGCHSSAIQHILLSNIPIGSLLFGYVAALNYDRQRDGNNMICTGLNCHSKTFIIWGSICSVGTILSFVLYRRTHKFYCK